MKLILILGCWLMAISAIITCGDDDDDSDDDNDITEDDDDDDDDNDDNNDNDNDDDNDDSVPDDDDDDTSTEEVWVDESTGLMWQVDLCSPDIGPWYWAKRACEELVQNDFDDWRLPTISELRTLVQGCDNTSTGGACNVTDSCLESSCENNACNGCQLGEGPNNGCYGNSALSGECYDFWSGSEVEDQSDSAWFISFDKGQVMNYYQTCDSGCEYPFRCVRDTE